MSKFRIDLDLERVALKELKVADIAENPLQPQRRTTETAVRVLQTMIISSRFIVPPVVVELMPGYYMVVDGHRRLYVARALGVERLQCLVVSITKNVVGRMFVWLNGGIKNVAGANWLTLWAKCPKNERSSLLSEFPSKQRRHVEEFIDIFGEARAVEIGIEGKQAPSVVGVVSRLMSAAIAHKLPFDKRAIGEWVIEHSLQRWIVDRTESLAHRRIVKAILEDIEAGRPPRSRVRAA